MGGFRTRLQHQEKEKAAAVLGGGWVSEFLPGTQTSGTLISYLRVVDWGNLSKSKCHESIHLNTLY